MNKTTRTLTAEEAAEIIEAVKLGGYGTRPNEQVALVLTLEANLGLRLSDIVPYTDKQGVKHKGLTLGSIKREAGRYHLAITEQKTGKARTFTVKPELYSYLRDYADEHGLTKYDSLCDISERRVQKILSTVCEHLSTEEVDYSDVSTHSFRKYFASSMYELSGNDIVLVQTLLQHSSPTTTRRYLGVSEARIEDALSKHSLML